MLATPPNAPADIRGAVLAALMRGVVHDVNNGLTAIGLAAELALRKQDAAVTTTALERAVGVSQTQRSHLDSMALLIGLTQDTQERVGLGDLVLELVKLCRLVCQHEILVTDHTDGLPIYGNITETAVLVAACLLDARVDGTPLTVILSINPEDDREVVLSLQAQELGHGALCDGEPDVVSGYERLAAAAGCRLIWSQDGGLTGLRFTLSK